MHADFPLTPRTTSSTTRPAHPLLVAIGLGLPVTLLVDLIDPNGPRSTEMLEREGCSPDVAAAHRTAARHAARTA